ncbi:MAG: hypothetical protein LH603_18210 [Pseudonocardia sp.]|nr:hypothetical protein [Pseudonocardia sp.]
MSDTGPGLALVDAERAFTRGWSTKPHGGPGRGIGLALVRQAAHRDGGRVEIERAGTPPGDTGATFVVHLPVPVRA